MATQLALQRNFVTIKSTANQAPQTAQIVSSATTNGGDIVTITAAGSGTATNNSNGTNSGTIRVMQPVQPVYNNTLHMSMSKKNIF